MAEQRRNEHGFLIPISDENTQQHHINRLYAYAKEAKLDVWQKGGLWVLGKWDEKGGKHTVVEVRDIHPDGTGGWICSSGPAGWYQPGK